MTENEKKIALSILSTGVLKIVNSYSENALLINACFVSTDRYKGLQGKMQLSTTQNIPQALRLDNEIEVIYQADDLARHNLDRAFDDEGKFRDAVSGYILSRRRPRA